MASGFDQLELELRGAAARQRTRRHPALGARFASRRAIGGMMTAASAAVVVVVVIGAVALLHGGTQPSHPAVGSTTTHRFLDPQGWSLAYPATLTLTSSDAPGSQPVSSQVTLASFAAQRRLMAAAPVRRKAGFEDMAFAVPLASDGKFPADGVALILQPSSAYLLAADSAFPVSLGTFQSAPPPRSYSLAGSRLANLPPARSRVIVAYGEELTATALIGSKAPASLKDDLAATIASLSFPRLRPGALIRDTVVLGPATAYPVWSYTLVHASFANGHSQRFYLVHAPGRLTYGHSCAQQTSCTPAGSFYAISGGYNTRRQHAPACDIQFDRRADDFFCTNMGVRWDRVGRVISRPADESYVGSLAGLYAKVAWDGQVMVMPGFGPQLNRSAVHELWPGWQQPNEPLSH
jgi:hypothetical protein